METKHQFARRFGFEMARRLLRMAGERGWSPCQFAKQAEISRELLYRVIREQKCSSLYIGILLCRALTWLSRVIALLSGGDFRVAYFFPENDSDCFSLT